jgi:uncharacterized protein YjbJ (UPF0337 family)
VTEHQRRRRGLANTNEAKGRAERAAGGLTGDDQLKREGTVDKTAGKAKDAVDKAAERAKGLMGKD